MVASPAARQRLRTEMRKVRLRLAEDTARSAPAKPGYVASGHTKFFGSPDQRFVPDYLIKFFPSDSTRLQGHRAISLLFQRGRGGQPATSSVCRPGRRLDTLDVKIRRTSSEPSAPNRSLQHLVEPIRSFVQQVRSRDLRLTKMTPIAGNYCVPRLGPGEVGACRQGLGRIMWGII